MPRNWLYAGFAVAFFTGTAISASAQSGIENPSCTGILHGTVSDEQGRPVPGVKVLAYPVGVDLDLVLPETTTNQAGEYRFDHMCPGRYTVLLDGLKVLSPYDFNFLFRRNPPEATLTDKNPTAEIPVQVPSRLGTIRVRVSSRFTNADIQKFTVEILLPRQRKPNTAQYLFNNVAQSREIPVPADMDFILRVAAPGFHKWTCCGGTHQLFHLQPGSRQDINAQLVPLSKN